MFTRVLIRERDHFISLEMASVGMEMEMMAAWGAPSIGARLAALTARIAARRPERLTLLPLPARA